MGEAGRELKCISSATDALGGGIVGAFRRLEAGRVIVSSRSNS